MPISTNASYIPTLDTFSAHWGKCNTALGATPLLAVPPGKPSCSRAQLDTLGQNLLLAQTKVQGAINDQEIARGDIDLQKAALLKTLNAFIDTMEAYYQGTKFYNAKPLAPGIGEGQERFTRPMVDAMTLWEKLNGAAAPQGVTLPLLVNGGVDQGGFASSISALQLAYRNEATAEQDVNVARTDRNLIQERVYEVLKAYRLAVPAKCGQFPNLLATLPKLTPEPGHTPDPVQASATYVAPSTSHIVWNPSTDPDIDYYDIEGTNGAEWKADDAIHLGRVQAGAPPVFDATFGLTQAGTSVALKVFAVLKTGNQAGSATLVVTRP